MNYITYRDIGKNGRLGNQLFQIAAVFGAAKKYNLTPVFPEWEYEKYFTPLPKTLQEEPTHHYREPAFSYNEIDLNDAVETRVGDHKIFNLHGYYQSERYFNNCERLVRNQFEPSDLLKNKLYEIPGRLGFDFSLAMTPTCSIHVRRGDYVDNPYYAQLHTDYYRDAVAYIKSHTSVSKFLVFSDDIEYCRTQFSGDGFVFVSGGSDVEDLILMSYCPFNICANSSFSWWAHYLNKHDEKIGIFPQHWFGPAANLDTKDLYPREIIKL